MGSLHQHEIDGDGDGGAVEGVHQSTPSPRSGPVHVYGHSQSADLEGSMLLSAPEVRESQEKRQQHRATLEQGVEDGGRRERAVAEVPAATRCLEAVRAPAPPVDKMTEEEMVDAMVQTLEDSKLRTRQLEGQVRCRSVALSSSRAHTVTLTSTLSPRCVGGERLKEAQGDEGASGDRDGPRQEGCRSTRGTVPVEEAAVERGAPRC